MPIFFRKRFATSAFICALASRSKPTLRRKARTRRSSADYWTVHERPRQLVLWWRALRRWKRRKARGLIPPEFLWRGPRRAEFRGVADGKRRGPSACRSHSRLFCSGSACGVISSAHGATHQLAQFAVPQHDTGHRRAQQPLVEVQRHGAEGEVEEVEIRFACSRPKRRKWVRPCRVRAVRAFQLSRRSAGTLGRRRCQICCSWRASIALVAID